MLLRIRRAVGNLRLQRPEVGPAGKLVAILLVIFVPGGLVLPVCCAIYAAIRRQPVKPGDEVDVPPA